jgi:hypothetical protein
VSKNRLKPNQELTVTMTTGKNSQVAISSVDQNVLLENQGNDLSWNKVYNGLKLYDNAGDMDLDDFFTDSYSKMLVRWSVTDLIFNNTLLLAIYSNRDLEPSC